MARFVLISVLVTLWAPAIRAAELLIPRTEASPGERVEVPLIVYSEGAAVKSVRTDMAVSAPLRLAQGDDGSPLCRAQSPFEGEFVMLPIGCSAEACNGFRATGSVTGSASGDVVVYSCEYDVSADAESGRYSPTIQRAEAFAADGTRIPTTSRSEGIVVPELPRHVTIEVGRGRVQAGELVEISVTLQSTIEAGITETDNVIFFFAEDGISVALDSEGEPRCAVNAEIDKEGSFNSGGNTVGAFIGDFLPIIPSGSVLYTCVFTVADSAAVGLYPLVCLDGDAAAGTRSVRTDCTDGELEVVAPDRTVSPSPAPTDSIATATPVPSAGDDGCSIPRNGSQDKELPVPLVLLVLGALVRGACRAIRQEH